MAKPNISPTTFRLDEEALEIVEGLKLHGLDKTAILLAGVKLLSTTIHDAHPDNVKEFVLSLAK